MAILHMEDFAGFGNASETILTAGLYAGLYGTSVNGSSLSFPIDPDGISNKRCLRIGNSGQNANSLIRKVLPSSKTTVGVMTRVWFDDLPSQGWNYPIVLLGAGTTFLYHLLVLATGRIRIVQGGFRSSDRVTIAESDGPVITAKGWWHIEWKTVISPTNGSFEVRVEGRPVSGLNLSGINTGATPVQQIGLGQGGETGGFGFAHFQKDLVVWDNEGSDVNDFIGTAIIHRHSLVEELADEWQIQGSGTSIEVLNSAPPVPNRYVFVDVDDAPSTYRASISPLPEKTTLVRAVQIRAMAAKNDGGDASLQNGIVADPVPHRQFGMVSTVL